MATLVETLAANAKNPTDQLGSNVAAGIELGQKQQALQLQQDKLLQEQQKLQQARIDRGLKMLDMVTDEKKSPQARKVIFDSLAEELKGYGVPIDDAAKKLFEVDEEARMKLGQVVSNLGQISDPDTRAQMASDLLDVFKDPAQSMDHLNRLLDKQAKAAAGGGDLFGSAVGSNVIRERIKKLTDEAISKGIDLSPFPSIRGEITPENQGQVIEDLQRAESYVAAKVRGDIDAEKQLKAQDIAARRAEAAASAAEKTFNITQKARKEFNSATAKEQTVINAANTIKKLISSEKVNPAAQTAVQFMFTRIFNPERPSDMDFKILAEPTGGKLHELKAAVRKFINGTPLSREQQSWIIKAADIAAKASEASMKKKSASMGISVDKLGGRVSREEVFGGAPKNLEVKPKPPTPKMSRQDKISKAKSIYKMQKSDNARKAVLQRFRSAGYTESEIDQIAGSK